MMSVIVGNLGTILITLFLVLLVTGIVRSMIKDKKKGVSSCGGNCARCNCCSHGLPEGTCGHSSH